MSFKLILIFLLISGCTNSTGFKAEPIGENAKKLGLEQNGVT